MESEPGSVWTLIMSFARQNKDVKSFKSKAIYVGSPQSPDTPNWNKYRIRKFLIYEIKNTATHWRVTCSFPQYGVNINTDYVRAAFADFDLMVEFWRKCKKVSYISVMGQSCSECTAQWTQTNILTPHIAAIPQNNPCYIKSDQSGHYYFGAYDTYNPNFRCTESPTSTTNYWFGSYVWYDCTRRSLNEL